MADSFENNDLAARYGEVAEKLVTTRGKDQLFAALGHLRDLEELVANNEELQRRFASEFGTMASALRAEQVEIEELLADFDNDDDWTLVKESAGVKTFYRHESSTPIHSIKMRGIIEAPAVNILACINEVDLYNTWMPSQLLEHRELWHVTNYRKAAYLRSQALWPVWARDVCLFGFGVDLLLERGAAVVAVRSMKPEDVPPDLPPGTETTVQVPPKHVRAECRIGGFHLRPLTETSCECVIVSNADPMLAFLPKWLLNMVVHEVAHYAFSMLRKQAARATEFRQRIDAKPHIYADVESRIDTYLRSRL
eukprot:TRINITY_DN32220_c0_g1_i1.p1 TRINITY_DN32220_c0_g1~~TRINITY_DN32220_c0_g1_i1.p1  ORF type:complete len:309 (+),score=111.01 TRINITY_DN32220_c0_g1_i1:122-1048(+)